jgi:uncharacterized small protein (DUF1192 family)
MHTAACDGVSVGARIRAPRHWTRAAAHWGWTERAAHWDAHCDGARRDRAAQDQADAVARHARLAQDGLRALAIPGQAALDILDDGALLPQLIAQARTDPDRFLALLGTVVQASRAIPGLVTVERLARGLTTKPVDVKDERHDVANRIAADPEATNLAIALLDRISQQPSDDATHRQQKADRAPTPARPLDLSVYSVEELEQMRTLLERGAARQHAADAASRSTRLSRKPLETGDGFASNVQ